MNACARRWTIPAAAALGVCLGGRALGQSLLEDGLNGPGPVSPANGALPVAPAAPSPSPSFAPPVPTGSAAERLQGASLFAVVPPKPRRYEKHDQIEVIINESTASKLYQKLNTEKDYNLTAELTAFPSLEALIEAQLRNNPASQLPARVGVKSKNKFEGDGTMERKENLTARISGKVVDVKPNGVLVIEARESRQQDEETYVLVLSGTCRSEDITKNNTIQSSQLADLTIRIDNEGQVKKAAEKGLIPRFFEFIFNF
ncbi:MAG: flagellar basal body L-ring protein FlgH [Phycisphaerales bacterium]